MTVRLHFAVTSKIHYRFMEYESGVKGLYVELKSCRNDYTIKKIRAALKKCKLGLNEVP